MLSLVLIRTIDRGSNAESQKKHRQRLNQSADAWGQKLRWQERQQLLYQKILSMDTKSETYTNLSCSLFTFYGILFPKLAESRCCLSNAEREREQPHRWLLLQPLMMESCPEFCFSTQSTCFTHRAESSVPISEKRSNSIAVSTQSAWFAQPCSHQLKLLGQAWKSSSHVQIRPSQAEWEIAVSH